MDGFEAGDENPFLSGTEDAAMPEKAAESHDQNSLCGLTNQNAPEGITVGKTVGIDQTAKGTCSQPPPCPQAPSASKSTDWKGYKIPKKRKPSKVVGLDSDSGEQTETYSDQDVDDQSGFSDQDNSDNQAA